MSRMSENTDEFDKVMSEIMAKKNAKESDRDRTFLTEKMLTTGF